MMKDWRINKTTRDWEEKYKTISWAPDSIPRWGPHASLMPPFTNKCERWVSDGLGLGHRHFSSCPMMCGKSVGTFYRRFAAQIPVGGAVAGAGVAGRLPVMFQQPESVESWSRSHEQTDKSHKIHDPCFKCVAVLSEMCWNIVMFMWHLHDFYMDWW